MVNTEFGSGLRAFNFELCLFWVTTSVTTQVLGEFPLFYPGLGSPGLRVSGCGGRGFWI